MSTESGSCPRCGETKKHESSPAEICLDGVWVLLSVVFAGGMAGFALGSDRLGLAALGAFGTAMALAVIYLLGYVARKISLRFGDLE